MKNHVRAALVVGAIFAAGLSQAELLHRYEFNDDASDSVGAADATICGTNAYIEAGGFYSASTDANRINGTLVDGIPRNGLLVPSSVVDGITGAFTIELWFSAAYGGPYCTAFSFSDGTTDNYLIGCPARGDWGYASSIDAKGGGSTPEGKLALGQYADTGLDVLQHMVATFDGTTLTYYQNGTTDYNGFNSGHGYSASVVATNLDLSTLPIIGVNGGAPWNDNCMAGYVWDFRIYDNAVSAGQAAALTLLGQDASNEDIADALSVPDAFGTITGSPDDVWMLEGEVTVQAVINHGASTVDTDETVLKIDGDVVDAVFDVASNKTTVSYIADLSHGVHTGQVEVVGTTYGEATNTWTFSVVGEETVATTLLHHYDFEETDGTVVHDIVGGSEYDGTIIGSNHSWTTTDGALDLFGGLSSPDWNIGSTTTNEAGSYVDLPNGMISALPDEATIEVTFAADDIDTSWQRVFDFGTSTLGEGGSETGVSYLFMTPCGAAGVPRVGFTYSQSEAAEFVLDAQSIAASNLVHMVFVYDASGKMSKMYQNGTLVNAAVTEGWLLSEIDDVNNWLGRAQWPDSMLNGQLYDLRIYSGIMTADEVASRADAMLNGGSGNEGPTVSPVIETITVNGTTVTLTWTDEGVGTYTIQSKTDLSSGSWTDVQTDLPAGQGSASFTSGEDQEFYQVIGE